MPLESTSTTARRSSYKLAALTTAVLLVHAGVLFGTPLSMAVASTDSTPAFTTRMIAPPVQVPPPEALPAAIPMRRLVTGAVRAPKSEPVSPLPSLDAGTGTPLEAAVPVEQNPVAAIDLSAMGQLLPANGPPANLTSAVPMAAAQEDKASPLPATGATAAAPLTGGGPNAKLANAFTFPAPMHLKYKVNGEVKGFPYYVRGDLQWQQDGKSYDARMEVSHFLLGSRVQTSRGDLSPRGLEPNRFGDKTRSEVAAHFERAKGKVTFSANTPEAPWVPGMQDQLSAFMQLASMLAGAPASFPEGTTIPLDAVGPRSVEAWVFKVGAAEKLNLPGGVITTVRLFRDAVGDYGTRGEVWLAPSMGYLPVRIRVTEANNDFMDMKWSDTVTP